MSVEPDSAGLPVTQPWLSSILEEHFESLQMLWELRLEARRDAAYDQAGLDELDQRLRAHLDGIVLSGQHSLPMIREALAGGERPMVFAAALAALHMQDPQIANDLWAAFDNAEGPAADGFVDAFQSVPVADHQPNLLERLQSQTSAVASAAAHILAFSGKLPADFPALSQWCVDEDEHVRRRAWDIVCLLGKA
ncbi:MAG: hypothetical protein KDB22_12805 [Planctomycetales bacterium]|nr:hypothetical protein [Planctomycetales bacterium]